MAEPRSDDRSQARREAAILLGVDIEHLSAADSLRVDMVSALRLVIDHEQATVLDGGGADLGKLNVAVQSLIALLPGRELPAPASSRPDPRAIMLETYKRMRERGAQFGLGYDGLKLRVEALEAELAGKDARIAELEAQLAGSVPLPPNAVKLRDNLRRSSAAVPAAPPKPAPPTDEERARALAIANSPVPQHVRDTRPPNEAWRNFVRIDWQG
jgi:hypothetical protein